GRSSARAPPDRCKRSRQGGGGRRLHEAPSIKERRGRAAPSLGGRSARVVWPAAPEHLAEQPGPPVAGRPSAALHYGLMYVSAGDYARGTRESIPPGVRRSALEVGEPIRDEAPIRLDEEPQRRHVQERGSPVALAANAAAGNCDREALAPLQV